MLKEDFNQCTFATEENHQNLYMKKSHNDSYDEPIFEIPDDLQIYLSKEYLTAESDKSIAIDELIDFFSEHQSRISRKSLKCLIFILDQQTSTDDSEFIQKCLCLISMILNNFERLELTSKEISIIRQYFPNQIAIQIISQIIQLHPPSSTSIVESFKPSAEYCQFNKEISMLLLHGSDDKLPILQLIYQISNKFEIASLLGPLFESLLIVASNMTYDEKKLLFKIMKRLCFTDKKYFQYLYNDDNVNNLYKNVCNQNEIVKPAFKFLVAISNFEKGYANPVSLFNRMNISNSVIKAIKTRNNQIIHYIVISFSDAVQSANDVDYFLENEYLRYLLSLSSYVSFQTWEEIVIFVCYLIYHSSSIEQVEFLVKHYKALNHIAKICETVEVNNNVLCDAIKSALQVLFGFAENQYTTHGIKIFTQEMREMLTESAQFEEDDDIHFLTDFIQKIDALYQ